MTRLTHTELQADTVQLLNLTGWSHLHVRRSIGKGKQWQTTTNIKGWPDLLCWNTRQPGRLLALELKVPPDWLSDDQIACLFELAAAGVECFVLVERFTPATDKPTAPGVDVLDLLGGLPALLRNERTPPMTDLASALADTSLLGDYRGHPVIKTNIAIRKAGDGLSKAMGIAPTILEPGDTVMVLLECEVDKHTFARVPETDCFTATIVDDMASAKRLRRAANDDEPDSEASGERPPPEWGEGSDEGQGDGEAI